MLKVCCYGAIFFAAVFAPAASAQVTVNWDVLGDDIGKPAVSVEKKLPEKVEKEPAPAKTTAPKPVEKKQKTTETEHDSLKPRANPVPVVKIISQKTTEPVEKTPPATPAEKPEPVTVSPVRKVPPVPAVKPVEAVNTLKEEKTIEAVPLTPAEVVETAEKTVASPVGAVKEEKTVEKTSEPLPQPVAAAEVPAPVVEEKEIPSPFDADEDLPENERSEALAALLPAGCPTLSLLSQHKKLWTVLEFEPRSVVLTEKTVSRLDKLAAYLTARPEKKVVVVSYTAPLSPEFGRERQLTLRRALAVRSALAEKGVRTLRVEIRSSGMNGAGDKYPDRADIIVYTR